MRTAGHAVGAWLPAPRPVIRWVVTGSSIVTGLTELVERALATLS